MVPYPGADRRRGGMWGEQERKEGIVSLSQLR